MNYAISIEGLNYTYEGSNSPALKNINLNMPEGKLILITGPSRAGKSTLCFTLNRLIPEHLNGKFSGRIMIKGEDISYNKIWEMGSKVGLVFQDFENQIFSTRVDLEVAFTLENAGLEKVEMRRRVNESIKAVGLAGLELRNPSTLSGGQKQRLAIASVLAMEPEIIVLDEPFTDIDPEGREALLAILVKLRQNGKTIIIVEHEIENLPLPDYCIVLNKGECIANGSAEDIFAGTEFLKDNGVRPFFTGEIFKGLGIDEITFKAEDAYKVLKEKNILPHSKSATQLIKNNTSLSPAIEFKGVWFKYPDGFEALNNINLTINSGDFVAIVGQNGSGKTTLAKQINRLLEPTKGVVIIFGDDIRRLRRSKIGRMVGYVFQNPDHQIFCETVYDEVAFALRNFGFDEESVRVKVMEAIATVGLKNQENSDPFNLSRGEREKVAVASVLSIVPDILIFDEPTTGLDYREIKNTMEMLKRLNEKGKTIIIITHSMHVVAEYSKSVIALKEGEIKFYGNTRDFFSDEKTLTELSLTSPGIIRLSRMFHRICLTSDEFLESFRNV